MLWSNPALRRVGDTKVGEDVWISTVFLVVDHNYVFGGRPLLFETMVFGGELDGSQEQYSTYAEALAGHERWVKRVRSLGESISSSPQG